MTYKEAVSDLREINKQFRSEFSSVAMNKGGDWMVSMMSRTANGQPGREFVFSNSGAWRNMAALHAGKTKIETATEIPVNKIN